MDGGVSMKRIVGIFTLQLVLLLTLVVPAFAEDSQPQSGPKIVFESEKAKSTITQATIDNIIKEHPEAKTITFYDPVPSSDTSHLYFNTARPQSVIDSYELTFWADRFYTVACLPTQYITSVAKGAVYHFSSTQTYSATVSAGTEVSGAVKVINVKATGNVSGTASVSITSSFTFSGPPESSSANVRTYYYLVNQEAYAYSIDHYILGIKSDTISGTAGVPIFTMISIDS
jgi:hypothetical protein